MIFRIRNGKHRAKPLRFRFWWDLKAFAWLVVFQPSCRYDLQGPDQLDTNKLIGIGYWPGHHTDSARFGWRYDNGKDQIEVMAYCYFGGRREIRSIAFVEIGKQYRLDMLITSLSYHLSVGEVGINFFKTLGEVEVNRNHGKKLQYRLGTFFGGNQVAPHEMKIKLQKT